MPAQIVDIHVNNQELNAQAARKAIVDGLSKPTGEKQLSTMLLYDERGLRLYDDITTEAPEYYLFGAEEEILRNHSDEIARVMHSGTGGVPAAETVIELGAGALRKTSHILRGLAHLVDEPSSSASSSSRPPITYYALDLEKRELERTLEEITMSDIGKELEGKVVPKGMWGTYEDGLKYVESGGIDEAQLGVRLARAKLPSAGFDRDLSPVSNGTSSASGPSDAPSDISYPSTPEESAAPLHIMFLGSSLGNFAREEQAGFLRSLPLRAGAGDTLLIGLDHDNEKEAIEAAYNDKAGHTKAFIMNGLKGAGRALGNESLFDENNWDYVNHYDPATRKHAAFYKAKSDLSVNDPSEGHEFKFAAEEIIKVEESVKFSDVDAYTLFSESNLRVVQRWTDSTGRYSLWLLERPKFTFTLLNSKFACGPAGDLVERKPYSSTPFGVPSPQDWQNMWAAWDYITLRMIPPSMLFQKPIDLRHICLFYLGHIPAFLDIHLSRLLKEPHTEPESFKNIFERGIDPNVDDPTQCHPHSDVPTSDEEWPTLTSILQFRDRVRERVLKLYSDIDSGKISLTRKVGRVLFMTFEHEALHAETLLYMLIQRAGSGTAAPSGFTPPDWESLAGTWAELAKPKEATVTLGPTTLSIGHDDIEDDDEKVEFSKEHEFGWDNESPKREVEVGEFKIDWRPVTNGDFYQFYKGYKGDAALDYPANWVKVDGEDRVRTLYGPVPLRIANEWPVITSYNNLSTYATVKGGRLPTEPELRLFYDKFESGYEGGSNMGFRNWHPVPATTGLERGGGRGGNGGVWEWTSTTFEKYEGFKASNLYPGYSSDFFDGSYNVVLGGSYATIPRIAERRTVRNWYQRNYPYSWVGGRVAYDVTKA